MKKFNILFFALALMFLGTLPSCDFLDVVPDEKATEADAFADRDAARRFLYSCYSYLPDPRNGTSSLDFMTADEVITAFEHETFARFPKGTYSASSPVISYWNTLFSGIKQCYILINNIEKVPMLDQNTLNDYVAQAKFLIGYYHFLLVRSYGPVIIIREEPSLTTPADQYAARSPYDECVDFVCEMFDEAAAGLPATRASESIGLATSVVAKALKARMLLYAASPLFNGNSEFYSNFTDKEGNHLISQSVDANKWSKAKAAYEEAIRAAEGAGHSLYMNTGDQLDGYSNIEPTEPIQHRLRYVIMKQANPEIIWSDSRSEGYYGMQNKGLPYDDTGYAWNGIAPTMNMLERFYTKNGLPITEDPEFPQGNAKYEVVTINDETIGDVGSKTVRFNVDREPRFYSWVAFQGGFFEVMSASGGYGAYDDDDSYWKYSDSQTRGKLVCNFVLGGNTSRWPAGAAYERNNNYSPSGYLNKKGMAPGYPVTTSYSLPPFYPWPLIRLAELYLGYAEACVECNDLGNAKTYLNKVRSRAGIPDVETAWAKTGKALDQGRMREVVRQERMIELYLENHTFWDLRRWKIAKDFLGKKARGMNISGTSIDAFAQETEIQFERAFESPTNYLMPIPLDDVNRNMNLVQNPGY